MIDDISDKTLKELFPVIKEIKSRASDAKRVEIVKQIIEENRSLLSRLAK